MPPSGNNVRRPAVRRARRKRASLPHSAAHLFALPIGCPIYYIGRWAVLSGAEEPPEVPISSLSTAAAVTMAAAAVAAAAARAVRASRPRLTTAFPAPPPPRPAALSATAGEVLPLQAPKIKLVEKVAATARPCH